MPIGFLTIDMLLEGGQLHKFELQIFPKYPFSPPKLYYMLSGMVNKEASWNNKMTK